jgi:hypothetical protein
MPKCIGLGDLLKRCNPFSAFDFGKLGRLNMILVALFFSFMCCDRAAYSAQVTLEWEGSSGGVAGYNVFQGTSSRNYDVTLDVGNWTSVTIADLKEGEAYYFAVTAYDSEGNESGYSNEVCMNCGSSSITDSAGGGGG